MGIRSYEEIHVMIDILLSKPILECVTALEALMERSWTGPVLFSMVCSTLLQPSINFHKKKLSIVIAKY